MFDKIWYTFVNENDNENRILNKLTLWIVMIKINEYDSYNTRQFEYNVAASKYT